MYDNLSSPVTSTTSNKKRKLPDSPKLPREQPSVHVKTELGMCHEYLSIYFFLLHLIRCLHFKKFLFIHILYFARLYIPVTCDYCTNLILFVNRI